MIDRCSRAGQSLIETCIAIGLICLIFMGLLQLSEMFAAKEILQYSAARGARAKTVGFNWWMVEKCIKVAAIPNAGRMTVPPFTPTDPELVQWLATQNPGEIFMSALRASPASEQYSMERARIPEYMYAANAPRAYNILDYEDWDSIHTDHGAGGFSPPAGTEAMSPMVQVRSWQNYPLWVPMHRAFYAADSIVLSGVSHLESHYDLYLLDMFY
jgi:hypothetical protein